MTIGYHDIADLPADKKRELLEKLLKEKNSQPPALPLSFAQQRLWFLDRLQPNSPVYNVPTIVRVQGKLVLPALQYALSKVVERHEVLRTVFHAADDFPTQRILEPVEVPLPLIDLETFSASEKERAARNEILKAARTPFDLSADLMLRATVVRLSEQEHLLLLVTHHIASDEWSLKILFREVAVFYSSFLHGEEPLLPPLEIQYADFALWQRETMQGKALETQLEWWRKRLSGRLPLLELPLDRPRAEGAAQGNGRLLQKQFSRELSEGVKSFSKQESVTLFMTMLAVFQALLHRYTDQEEIIVGSPIAGRTRMETEELIGFFVNTLPLRSTFAGNPTFRNLLQQVKETTLGAYAHQEVPFEKIVEALHPERSASRTPFVQVVFSLNNDFVPSELIPGLKCEWIEVDTLTAKFDLTMIVKDHPEGLDLVLEYNSDLFEAATIERLLGHYENLLTEAIRNPAVPLVQLPLLTPGERALMIENWNRTNSEYPRHDSINQLFEAQVIRTPEAIALSYGGEEWSYRELNVAANQLAQRLRRLRVAHGSLIGIYAERSPKMIVAMLAVLKSGAAYVPLDSSYPQSRLQFMIEDTGMQVIITQENLAMALPPHSASIILLDRDWHEIEQESWCLPANQATAESLAYVIYTSGSTGKPKGVAVRHRGVTRLVCNTDYVKITSADRLAQASNASFDAATFEIWGALLNGARLVGISKDTAISPTDFSRQLVEQKISILFITTALFNQLAANAPESFGHLDTVMFGGEAVDPKWVRLVLDAHPPKRLLHVYGPTENTTFSTWHLITSVDENATTIPIGRPIANSEAYILDRSLNP
ncbi:MAG: condensation domain-containing protein, partial [Verrucomicrobiota bacterium]|nr:condensation domain-containing protein [Verrucomicrobiota bacterium]